MSDEEQITEYCTVEEVNSLFGDISDDVSTEMFTTAIHNSTAWIESNLKRNYIPIPTTVPNALRTVSIYHSASDILLSLYHGDELPIQYDVWFKKAEDLLQDYITSYLRADASDSEKVAHQLIKHTRGRTYNEKRGRGLWRI